MTENRRYWEEKYTTNNTGWDIGHVSSPLKNYINQLTDKKAKILVPGVGYGHEAKYLFEKGFTNLFVLDIAQQPLQNFMDQMPGFPIEQIIHADFFDLPVQNFDLVLEQTFFCALLPPLRKKYVLKMKGLLKEKGKLAGLLFNFPLSEAGPPFGGSEAGYRALFKPHFNIKVLEPAYNSIKPRHGKELFFIFEKK